VEEYPNYVRSKPPDGNFIALTLTPGKEFEPQNNDGTSRIAKFLIDEVINPP